MKRDVVAKPSAWLLLLLALMLSAGCTARPEPASPRTAPQRATTSSPPPSLVTLLVRGELAKARARFGKNMQAHVSQAALQRMWRSRLQTYGPLQRHRPLRRFSKVIYACKNARHQRTWSVVVNRAGRIVGIFRARPESDRVLPREVQGQARRALGVVAPFLLSWESETFAPHVRTSAYP